MAFEVWPASLIYNFLKDVARLLMRRLEKDDPAALVQTRQRWKSELEQRFRSTGVEPGWYGEAIIRDVKRVDHYPDVNPHEKRISAWFKVGLLGTYHRGLLVGLRIVGLKRNEATNRWRGYDRSKGEQPGMNAFLVGRIPYEYIVSIDWEGDEYYALPIIYCRYASRRKEPYEEIVLCEKRGSDNLIYYAELAKQDDVRKLNKKLGIDSAA